MKKYILSILFSLLLIPTITSAYVSGSPFGPVPPSDLAYNATTWDSSYLAPTQNAVRDWIESFLLVPVAAGADTQVQYNSGGSLAGDAGLTYNDATNALTAVGPISASTADLTGVTDGNIPYMAAAGAGLADSPLSRESATGVTLPDDGTFGLGAAKGRIEFDDQATDEVNILDANMGIGTSAPADRLDITSGGLQIQAQADDFTIVNATSIGLLKFYADDDTASADEIAGQIEVVSDATWTDGAESAYMAFSTIVSGTVIEGVRIDSNAKTQIYGISVLTKTADYTVTTSDFGKSIRINNSTDHNFTLPSVGATEDGARLTFIKQGTGKMTLTAVDSDTIHDSSAAGTIYTETLYSTITIEYVHGMTRWVIISATGTLTTT